MDTFPQSRANYRFTIITNLVLLDMVTTDQVLVLGPQFLAYAGHTGTCVMACTHTGWLVGWLVGW